jgi:hypothetical protein
VERPLVRILLVGALLAMSASFAFLFYVQGQNFAGYIFVFIAYIFPIFQWFIAYFGIKKCVVPLRGLVQFKKVMRPEGKQGYRDVVGVDKLPDPAVSASAGAGAASGADSGTYKVPPIPTMEHYLKVHGDEYFREELEGRICRLNNEPITEEYMKRARKALQGLYGLVKAEGIAFTRDYWLWLINYLDDGIMFAAGREIPYNSSKTEEVRKAEELLLKAEGVFQDRVILLTAYVTFTADVLFEDFRRQGLTRARNKEEFIEERINAARGFLSPRALLRPEGNKQLKENVY